MKLLDKNRTGLTRLRWRCITRDQGYRHTDESHVPRPPLGAGLAQRGRGAFNTTRNQSLEYDSTQTNYDEEERRLKQIFFLKK
jgi:hypothetical protein